MSESVITLASICKGAPLELFEAEFEKVLRNIADVNTSPKVKRTITLKIVISPDDNREAAAISVQSNATLAPIKKAESVAYLGKKDGKLIAVENNPNQSDLFDKAGESTVAPFAAVNGGAK